MSSPVPFPSRSETRLPKSSSSTSLVSSRQSTALEVCDLVYGEAEPPDSEIVNRIYETNAGMYTSSMLRSPSYDNVPSVSIFIHSIQPGCMRTVIHSYMNPLVTASSREHIADLYALCKTWGSVDVPRPLALISALLGRMPGTNQVLLHGVRAWSEVSDVCESESFGKTIYCASCMPY
jgi:hypothetical protein